MNRRQRRKLEKENRNMEGLKVAGKERRTPEEPAQKMNEGLAIAGTEPPKKSLDPRVIPSQEPVLYGDWFSLTGGIGAVIRLTFAAHIPGQQLVKEACTVVLPNEIAVDLIDKLAQAYQHFPEKK